MKSELLGTWQNISIFFIFFHMFCEKRIYILVCLCQNLNFNWIKYTLSKQTRHKFGFQPIFFLINFLFEIKKINTKNTKITKQLIFQYGLSLYYIGYLHIFKSPPGMHIYKSISTFWLVLIKCLPTKKIIFKILLFSFFLSLQQQVEF